MADDLQKIYETVQDCGGYRPASRELGIPESTLRRWLRNFEPELPDHAYVPDPGDLPDPHIGPDGVPITEKRKPGTVQRFILTSAQNNARVHEGFLRNLLALAAEVDAEILVSYTLYDRTGYRGVLRKGDTQIKKQDIWWDRATKPYAVNTRVRLHDTLAFCGELDILATAKNPLSGMQSYCGASSTVIPHNKFAFQCVPSRKGMPVKEMYTTGSLTERKFIQRKAGQLAHFHHVLGALLVEVDADGDWFVHHLNADPDGSFYWLDRHVGDGRVSDGSYRPAGMVLGDIHAGKLDFNMAAVTINAVSALQPGAVVLHDLIDFTARNHHSRNDPIFKIKARNRQRIPSVEQEFARAADLITSLKTHSPESGMVVAASNHDDAFTRWLKETDWRDDPENAEFYLDAARQLVGNVKSGRPMSMLRWAIDWIAPGEADVAQFLAPDDSYEIAGIECGMHGHLGPNGARGSPRSFAHLGFKSFTGHTHTPGIIDGAYTVGVTGNLDMGYNVGPSSWVHAHGLIYPNGKRAFVFIRNGKWRA